MNYAKTLFLCVREVQKTLLGEEIEQYYNKLSSVFRLKGGRDWAGRRAYLGRQPI